MLDIKQVSVDGKGKEYVPFGIGADVERVQRVSADFSGFEVGDDFIGDGFGLCDWQSICHCGFGYDFMRRVHLFVKFCRERSDAALCPAVSTEALIHPRVDINGKGVSVFGIAAIAERAGLHSDLIADHLVRREVFIRKGEQIEHAHFSSFVLSSASSSSVSSIVKPRSTADFAPMTMTIT